MRRRTQKKARVAKVDANSIPKIEKPEARRPTLPNPSDVTAEFERAKKGLFEDSSDELETSSDEDIVVLG